MSEEENYKCSVSLTISLKEGSATIDIENREMFASTQKVGKALIIICDVQLTNVDLEKPNDPNNVDWYKVNQENGEDTKIVDTDTVKINKLKGIWFCIYVSISSLQSLDLKRYIYYIKWQLSLYDAHT